MDKTVFSSETAGYTFSWMCERDRGPQSVSANHQKFFPLGIDGLFSIEHEAEC